MLRLYKYYGKDNSSDSGQWCVILWAYDATAADKILLEYLTEHGRLDLWNAPEQPIRCVKLDMSGIVYSGIERKTNV